MAHNSGFHELAPLISEDLDALSEMVQRIEEPVFECTYEYVRQIIESIGADAVPLSRQALMANDPYFIGAAHHRLRFDREEIIGNCVFLLRAPGENVVDWDGIHRSLIVVSEDYDAGRDTYEQAQWAPVALIASVMEAYDRIKLSPAHAVCFAAGTRRLSISKNCIGSSSISSLPGYSLIQGGQSGAFGNRQLNGMVHESIHGLLFLAECRVGRQLVKEGSLTKIRSPWSGNLLDIYQYVQAVMVWYKLFEFWHQLAPESEEFALASRGFEKENTALLLLEQFADEVETDYFDILHACAKKAGMNAR